jgi:hypothetical protein
MKIQHYGMQPNSVHRLEKSKDTLRQRPAWTADSQSGSQPVSEDPSFNLEINQWSEGYSALKTENTKADSDHAGQDAKIETNLRLIEALVYQMLGKRIKLQLKRPWPDASRQEAQLAQAMSPVQERDGWGLIYEYQEAVAEQESIQFNSGGTVTTADGRALAFSLEFSMSRAYYEQSGMEVHLNGAAKVDEFAVAMERRSPSLSSDKADYSNEFTELRAYDLEHDGWIGEADVCGRLSILPLSEKGDKTLIRLADVGIGAIYLQEVDTPYEVRDMTETYGDVRSGSAYLKGSGRAGVHHIDLSL